MIKIIGKFTRDGEIVAWRVDDDGVEYNVSSRAPYHEFFYKSFLESGFKYHDYHGDISTPDGMKISDVVESTEYLSDSELIDLTDAMEVGMVDEREFLQYFDRSVTVKSIELPTPTNIIINTREELVSHLKLLKDAHERNITKFNPTCINSYANPEALFSLEEIAANENGARNAFVSYFEGHVMTAMSELTKLINMYGGEEHSYGDALMASILKGYFAYGIPCIRATITSMDIQMNPTESIRQRGESVNSNVMLKYGIMDSKNSMLYCEDIEPTDYYDLAGDDVVDTNASIRQLSISTIAKENLNSTLMAVPYGYKKANPRIVIEAISDDGIKVTFISDCNEAHLYRGVNAMTPTLPMFSYRTIDNNITPLSRIAYNGISYIGDSVLIRAFIKEQLKASTVPPKYKTSFELMCKVGVSPYYAPMYAAKMIGGGAATYTPISDTAAFASAHAYCSKTFRDGFSQKIIEKYGSTTEEFSELPIEEQVEFINEEIDNLQSQGRYMVCPEIPAGSIRIANPEYNEWFDEKQANEVGNVNFVLSLFNGEQNVGKMAVGMNLDSSTDTSKIYNLINSAYVIAKSENPLITCGDFLSGKINEILDLSKLFKPRKSTAIGCMKDEVIIRSDMAVTCDSFVYITKVFRENGNATYSEARRHYGFECLVFDKSNGTKGGQIFKALYDQMYNDLSAHGHKDCLSHIGDAVATTMMKIFISKERATPMNGVCSVPYSTTLMDGAKYAIDFKLGESFYNVIKNGSLLSKKYASCYDFCENQFSEANNSCVYYSINAAVNPWAVVPREGFKIPEYNLFVNYFKMEELVANYPSVVVDRIKESGAKVIPCLREDFTTMEMFPSMPSIFSKAKEIQLSKEGFFLSEGEFEDIECYMTRTINTIKEYKADGSAVKNTILKSDLVLSMFKPYVWNDGVEQDETFYEDFSNPLCNKHVSFMEPRMLTSDWVDDFDDGTLRLAASSSNGPDMERVKFSDIPYNWKEFNTDLCTGNFCSDANVFISDGKLNYKNGKFKSLLNLSRADMDELCSEHIAIQVNYDKYIIKTMNGLIKVGVEC